MGNEFKWRHFNCEIILWAVRWYCRYGISYRELQEMLEERGIEVNHVTIYRWVQHYAPKIKKKLRWYLQHSFKILQKEQKLTDNVEHRQVKYLNNRIESDHGKLKRLINPCLGFKSLKKAYATIQGFEIMRALKKGQFECWPAYKALAGQICLIQKLFFA